ncbi:MAG: FKBP-type peptidyl-prolyl cis-trans isomerase [Flavobacteriaceae bacterium]|jgi:gliding motility-associated peptidyl-prolyl isomerase|nr:FKBP-type peptidyl-prolyl cis-trans isomerase [Flavobacteriaceae bacterium]
MLASYHMPPIICKSSIFLIFALLLSGCQKKDIVYSPIHQKKSDFIKKSQEISKKREENERKFLEIWVKQREDSLNIDYQETASGIWIRYINKNDEPKAQDNDFVTYTAEIRTLAQKVIYTKAEFGEKKIILGKYNEIRGIESALHLLSKGETVELLLPSFNAYGLYGDEKKIGANVPLIVGLEILDVKQKE